MRESRNTSSCKEVSCFCNVVFVCDQYVTAWPESECDVMCSQVHNLHIHSSEHIHTLDTHPGQWAAILLRCPESIGVPCSRAHHSRVLKLEESAVQSLPPCTFSAGAENWTRNIRVRMFRMCTGTVAVFWPHATGSWIRISRGIYWMIIGFIQKLCILGN